MRVAAAVLGAVVISSSTLGAQQRRSADSPVGAATTPVPITLPDIPYNAEHPLAGVWQGEFVMRPGESAPYTLVVEFLNGGYHSYSYLNAMPHPIEPTSERVMADTVQWETRNSGGGFLVYKAHLTGRNTMAGTMTFRDLPFDPGPERPTLALRRRT